MRPYNWANEDDDSRDVGAWLAIIDNDAVNKRINEWLDEAGRCDELMYECEDTGHMTDASLYDQDAEEAYNNAYALVSEHADWRPDNE